jgi:hypothetical protein
MIPDHAQTLYSRFEQEGIPLLLAGGWAVNHHGYSRYTRDVDWISKLRLRHTDEHS